MFSAHDTCKKQARVWVGAAGGGGGGGGAAPLSQLSVRLVIWAQVMILQFVGLNLARGSELMVQSLLGILSLPFCLPPLVCSLSLKISK